MERGFKKPRYRGKFRSGGMQADQAYLRRIAGARRLRRRRYNYPSIKQEPKFYDTSLVATAITYSTDFTSCMMNPSATSMISTPSVGDSEQNRDGKKIIITQVEVKGFLGRGVQYNNQSALDDVAHAWVALVLDTQTNNAQMTSDACFKAIGGTAGTIQPFRNLLYGGRFKILKMKRFTFRSGFWSGTAPNISQEGQGRCFTMFKKLRLPVNFNAGTTSSIANVQDNSLHIIAWASDATWSLGYQARIRFVG